MDPFAFDLSFRYWEYTGSAWTYNTYTVGYDEFNVFLDLTDDNWNSIPPKIVSYIELATNTLPSSLQVCSFQIFGWPYCYADPKTPIKFTTPPILFNSEETKTSISLGNLQTYYDPDLFKINNLFCHLGFESGITLTLDNKVLTDSTYTLDPLTLLLTLNSITGLKTYSSMVKNLSISIVDTRNPSAIV